MGWENINFAKPNELFCGTLKDMNVERNANDGSLDCEVPERQKLY